MSFSLVSVLVCGAFFPPVFRRCTQGQTAVAILRPNRCGSAVEEGVAVAGFGKLVFPHLTHFTGQAKGQVLAHRVVHTKRVLQRVDRRAGVGDPLTEVEVDAVVKARVTTEVDRTAELALARTCIGAVGQFIGRVHADVVVDGDVRADRRKDVVRWRQRFTELSKSVPTWALMAIFSVT